MKNHLLYSYAIFRWEKHWRRNEEDNLLLSRECCSLWSASFWNLTPRIILGTISSRKRLSLKIVLSCCSEKSSRNCKSSDRKISKEGISHFHKAEARNYSTALTAYLWDDEISNPTVQQQYCRIEYGAQYIFRVDYLKVRWAGRVFPS